MARKTMEKPEAEFVEEHPRQSFKWVKGDSGNTYLCPIDALKDCEHATEEQLKSMCVDESMNPQNE